MCSQGSINTVRFSQHQGAGRHKTGIIHILQAIKDWRWEQPGNEASVLLCYDMECIVLCGNGEIEAVWSTPLK